MNPTESEHASHETPITRAEAALRTDLATYGSLDTVIESIEFEFRHSDDASDKAELLRLQRFARTATDTMPGDETAETFSFYKGELLGYHLVSNFYGNTLPTVSPAIQNTINTLLSAQPDYMQGVGDYDRVTDRTKPVPNNVSYLQKTRMTRLAGRLFEYSSMAADDFAAAYDPIKQVLHDATKNLPVDEAIMVQAGTWLVLKEALQPNLQAETDKVLADATVVHVPKQLEHYQLPSLAPIETIHADAWAIDESAPEYYFDSIDALRDSLQAKTYELRSDLPISHNPKEVEKYRKELQSKLRTYLETNGELPDDTLIAVSGKFFFHYVTEENTIQLDYLDTHSTASELRGEFISLVVHQGVTPKMLKEFDPDTPQVSKKKQDLLMPHIRLKGVSLVDPERQTISTHFPGYVDVPLLYPTTSFKALFEATD